MDDDNRKQSGQFDASWQLPDENKYDNQDEDRNSAADLIRKKVEAAYTHEPDAEDEAEDLEDLGKKYHKSKHQEFIYNLTNSGRPLHEVQTAWHEYYAGLPDNQKHQVWQEFYAAHAEAAHHPAMTRQEAVPRPHHEILERPAPKPKSKAAEKLLEAKNRVKQHPAVKKSAANQTLHSLLFGLGTGSAVILIFMFSFFNERIIAPFIQPSRTVSNIPIIAGTGSVGPDPEVIIPKINVEIPVVYDPAATNDTVIQKDLEQGVVHYAGTASPGQDGNLVIVGHSSNNIFNPGKYKFAFVLLHQLEPGDTFYLLKDGKRYTYQIYKRQVVSPDDVSVLGAMDKPATATLITCDPPGTSNNRLVVTGEQIDPSPDANLAAASQTQVAKSAMIIPGNSPSLWSRLTHWFTE
jgi:sortase A